MAIEKVRFIQVSRRLLLYEITPNSSSENTLENIFLKLLQTEWFVTLRVVQIVEEEAFEKKDYL